MNRLHIHMLRRGVAEWNDWREKNPFVRPNLSRVQGIEVDLSCGNFSFANLQDADLSHLQLKQADLSFADLQNAQLVYTDLTDTDFEEANLNGVNFKGANLLEAVHLDIEQLAKVRTLYNAKLKPALLDEVRRELPHLLRDVLNVQTEPGEDNWFFKVIGPDNSRGK